MAITIGTLSSSISGLSYTTWGITLINTEIFVGAYGGSNTSIYVYDANTYAYKRTLTTSAFAYSMGTDGTNLYVKNSSSQIVLINKDTGVTISTKTNVTFTMNTCASFKIDIVDDRIYYCDYNTTLYIKKYSDGTTIATYTMPANVTGVDVIKNKYIVVCSKSTGKYLNIAPIVNNNVTSLSFTQYSLSSSGTGIIYYNEKLIFSSYSTTILSGTISGLNLYTIKYLLKQNLNYYTTKTTNYDSTTTHNFTPLTLTGGTMPNVSDIDNFGFDDLSILTNNMIVGSDVFEPISKFDNTTELKFYKPS
jgi:hypothetical protein